MVFNFHCDEQGRAVTNVPYVLTVTPSGDGFQAPFTWQEECAGSSRLAANVLAACGLPEDSAWRLALRFSREVLCKLPPEGGCLPASAVRAWLDANPDGDAGKPFQSRSECTHGHHPIVNAEPANGV